MLEQNFKNILLNIKYEIKNSQIKTMFEVNKNLIMLFLDLEKLFQKIVNMAEVLLKTFLQN